MSILYYYWSDSWLTLSCLFVHRDRGDERTGMPQLSWSQLSRVINSQRPFACSSSCVRIRDARHPLPWSPLTATRPVEWPYVSQCDTYVASVPLFHFECICDTYYVIFCQWQGIQSDLIRSCRGDLAMSCLRCPIVVPCNKIGTS